MFLTDEKALATKSLVILDVRPEEQIAKEHITKAEYYSRVFLSCDHYETEVTLIVCCHVYGTDEVVST
ncbi:Uncharacterized protein BM_BM10996 [Brugia malayi]|uniref:Rhodanese domain-containing protein n=1 Tax=Brugia malayi TaxID=6279 RepID=A0A4E9ERP6_BRUMA|nr:Uncharacterized protein BM_BM10996 [Brugia malayi]VIO86662.1 Uncharacterized protein BM_BM10996 [Brugia malayi]